MFSSEEPRGAIERAGTALPLPLTVMALLSRPPIPSERFLSGCGFSALPDPPGAAVDVAANADTERRPYNAK